MAVQTLRDLFLYELSAMYDVEQQLLRMTPQIMQEINVGHAQSTLQQHDQETRQQIQNLDRCLQILGEQPQPVKCYVVQGFEQDHDAFLRENPSPEILALYDLRAQEKIELYESTAYRGLIEKANLLGQPECARLLQENLAQEEAEARRLHQLSTQLSQQMIQQTGQQAQRRA